MDVQTKTLRRCDVVVVKGRIDSDTVKILTETFAELKANGRYKIVLNLKDVTYISSAGLRVLLYAQREARQRGGEVRVFGPNAQVRRVIELAGFEKLIYVRDTRQEAMEDW